VRQLGELGAKAPNVTLLRLARNEEQKVALARAIDVADPRWQPLQIEVNTVDAFQGRPLGQLWRSGS
jgi:hypothetical protein